MPDPNTSQNTAKTGGGNALKRSRLLKFFRGASSSSSGKAKAGPAVPPLPTQPLATASNPAAGMSQHRDAARDKARAEQLHALSRDTQDLQPLVEHLQKYDPSLKEQYFAIKQAVFDKDLEGATARLQKFKPHLEDFERSVAGMERSKAAAQAKYLQDMGRSGKGAASGNDADGDDGVHKFGNLTSQKVALDLSGPKVQAIMKAHGVTEAEAVAIRVFTQQDYAYVNPAVANQQDRTDRKDAAGREWMDAKMRPKVDPEADARFTFSGMFSEAPAKSLQAVLKAKGKGPVDPDLAKLMSLVPAIGQGTSDISAEDFEKLHSKCFAKLPSYNPAELKGADLATYHYLRKLLDEVDDWVTHESKQAERAADPEKLKAYNKARDEQLAKLKVYEEGGADEAGSKRSLSQEGVAHAAIALEGLRKLPLEEVTLYRGLNMTPAQFEAQYRGGKTITCEALISYSMNQQVARDFRSVGMPKGNIMVMLEMTAMARNIEDLSVTPTEAERVLLPGDTLLIESITDKGQDGFLVKLRDPRVPEDKKTGAKA